MFCDNVLYVFVLLVLSVGPASKYNEHAVMVTFTSMSHTTTIGHRYRLCPELVIDGKTQLSEGDKQRFTAM